MGWCVSKLSDNAVPRELVQLLHRGATNQIGVRGHEAKAIMRDRMKLGDKVGVYATLTLAWSPSSAESHLNSGGERKAD